MKLMAINYTLHWPGQNYRRLANSIPFICNQYAHVSDSFWLIKTEMTCAQIRNSLKLMVDTNDLLMISEVQDWASYNLPPNIVVWADGVFSQAA